MWKKCKNDLAKVWLVNWIQQKHISAKQETQKWVEKSAATLYYSYVLWAAWEFSFEGEVGGGF